jgi:hypothetical protein
MGQIIAHLAISLDDFIAESAVTAFQAGTRASRARVSETTRSVNSGSRTGVDPFIGHPFSSS